MAASTSYALRWLARFGIFVAVGASSGCWAPGQAAKEPDAQQGTPLEAAKAMIPPGSADYSAVLADAIEYKTGKISFGELKDRVLARKLPPHKLGDGYLMMTPPPPPDGTELNPLLMPSDWKGNWGEVAMTMFAGQITQAEYDELHAEAHPDEKKP